jgi:hypothetical protein
MSDINEMKKSTSSKPYEPIPDVKALVIFDFTTEVSKELRKFEKFMKAEIEKLDD